MTEQDPERPPYDMPELGERVMVYDGTVLGTLVPAVYLGFEHISGDFYMHNVRSDGGVESSLAPHDVHTHRIGSDGERWVPLMGWPTARYGGPSPTQQARQLGSVRVAHNEDGAGRKLRATR